MRTIQRRMATGIVWMVFSRLMDRGVGVISVLILARLLVPDDFGLVAMATAIGSFLDLLGAFSFDVALIQNQEASKKQYDTVWTFNVLFGLLCATLLTVLASPASQFYREPRLTAVMYVFAMGYLISGFGNVGTVNIRKNLEFRKEFVFSMSGRLISFALTIALALWLRSYWALVAGTVAGRVAGVVISYIASSYRPRFGLSAASELFHFSKWMFVNNTLNFLQHSGPNFLIGRVSGAGDLGTYTVAYEISNLASSELVAPINRATFPGFAKLDRPGVADAYLRVLGMIALLILPVGVGIAAVAEPLVLVALGENWRGAVALIGVLAFYGVLAAIVSNNAVVWIALGRPRDVTIVGIAFVALLFGTLIMFLGKYGIVGAGYAYLVAQSAVAPASLWNTKRLLRLRWMDFVAATWRPILGVIVMYVCVVYFDKLIIGIAPLPRLAASCLVGAAIYVSSVLTFWLIARRPPGAEAFCIGRVVNSLLVVSTKNRKANQ
jgi:lipopolysaccharide exporter